MERCHQLALLPGKLLQGLAAVDVAQEVRREDLCSYSGQAATRSAVYKKAVCLASGPE